MKKIKFFFIGYIFGDLGTVRCDAFWKGKDILCLLSRFI